jgi:molybdenum cofactor cytidylyltransferase
LGGGGGGGRGTATERSEGLLVTLVDVPMIAASTVAAVVDTWHRTRAPIVRPLVDGRRGHPVVFDRAVFAELRHAPLEEGARRVVRAHWGDAIDVPVEDRGCLIDIDTPADYEQLRRPES